MWLISKKNIPVPIAAALVAALAAVTLTPAADTKKPAPPTKVPHKPPEKKQAPASTRKLPKPVIVYGKGKAQPKDLAALKDLGAKDTPAYKSKKINFKKMSPVQKLTQQEKVNLVTSLQPALRKTNPHFDVKHLDFRKHSLSLTPRTPWVNDKGFLDVQGGVATGYNDEPPGIGLDGFTNSITLTFNCPEAGWYLITFHVSISDQSFPVNVTAPDGTIQGPGNITLTSGDGIVPILFMAPDPAQPWHSLTIADGPHYYAWGFSSVDVQSLGQNK